MCTVCTGVHNEEIADVRPRSRELSAAEPRSESADPYKRREHASPVERASILREQSQCPRGSALGAASPQGEGAAVLLVFLKSEGIP